MEMLVVLALLGGGAYWFFRGNTRRGAEIMRAHIFLGAMKHGKSVVEANGYASADMSEAPVEFFHNANLRATHEYGGQKLAMVGQAYKMGMHPKLPPWDRSSVHVVFNEWKKSTLGKQPINKHNAHNRQLPSGPFPDNYDAYYAIYLAELKRLSGLSPDQHHRAELMEEIGEATGDNLTRQNFENGVDPKEYAAAVHAVMERMPPDATAF